MKNIVITEKEFPIKPPSADEMIRDFKKLRDNSYAHLLKDGQWFTRYEYRHKFIDKYIDIDNTGLISSNFFHFKNRMCCDSLNSPCPVRNWFNPKLHGTLQNSKIGDDKAKLHLRKYVASQFRPTSAKCLYEVYGAKVVFDPCMGWGDRLNAALATRNVKTYYGLDVNQYLFLDYQNQKRLNPRKQVVTILDPAEKHDHIMKYDFVFTSPPYYKIEKYDGLWSSHKQYTTFDSWLKNFLFKMLENTFKNLKAGGTMMINISDVYADHTVNRICDPMVDYMISIGAKYEGAIGYKMRKRPNSKADDEGIFAEPIWIFKKESE